MTSQELKEKMQRFDIDDWLIHFTHGNLTTQESSFQVLQTIIQEGSIKCGWSERNGKPTIFGEYPAVCFTEMSLYSLREYVWARQETNKIDFYGIALPKSKLFGLGARNVIYGLTNEEKEHKALPNEEQYRYVKTNLVSDKPDWTHEREWRWTNQQTKYGQDALPVWSNICWNDYDYNTWKIFIIVRYDDEITKIKELFSTLSDEKIYSQHNIERTFIISLERLLNIDKDKFEKARFSDLKDIEEKVV